MSSLSSLKEYPPPLVVIDGERAHFCSVAAEVPVSKAEAEVDGTRVSARPVEEDCVVVKVEIRLWRCHGRSEGKGVSL